MYATDEATGEELLQLRCSLCPYGKYSLSNGAHESGSSSSSSSNSNSNGIVQCASCKHCENADEYQAPYFVSAAAASAAAGGGGSGSNANTVSGASKFNAEFIKYAHAE